MACAQVCFMAPLLSTQWMLCQGNRGSGEAAWDLLQLRERGLQLIRGGEKMERSDQTSAAEDESWLDLRVDRAQSTGEICPSQ